MTKERIGDQESVISDPEVAKEEIADQGVLIGTDVDPKVGSEKKRTVKEAGIIRATVLKTMRSTSKEINEAMWNPVDPKELRIAELDMKVVLVKMKIDPSIETSNVKVGAERLQLRIKRS